CFLDSPCTSDSDCGSGGLCIISDCGEFGCQLHCCSSCSGTCGSSAAPTCGGSCPSSSQFCRQNSGGNSCACVCDPALSCPFVTKWGSSGTGDGQFNRPGGVAMDGSGNVFVVDSGNSRIQKFTNTGTFLAKWGSLGSGDGQFNEPRGVAVDGSGNVFVADSNNNRIQKFTNTGSFLLKWGSMGCCAAGQFSFPVGVAVDGSGNVFVADNENIRIQK